MDDTDLITLISLVECDASKGTLSWKRRPLNMFKDAHSCNAWNARYAGRPIFQLPHTQGYFKTKVLDRRYYSHRLIWALHHGVWPSHQIDHINGDRTDNRIENLRDVPQSQNAKNRCLHKNNTSGVHGVTWNLKASKWVASIKENNMRRHLGNFEFVEDAISARKEAERGCSFHPNHGRSH